MSFRQIDRNAILEDEHQQRLRRIKLIERENVENAPQWLEKQQLQFPSALALTPTPSLGQVITEEIQANAYNEDVLRQRAEMKIKEIADIPNTEYILDRLEPEDLYFLVNSWNKIIKKIKEEYSTKGLDKNIFISIIKDGAIQLQQDVDKSPALSQYGQIKEGIVAQRKKEIEDKINEEKEKELEEEDKQEEEVAKKRGRPSKHNGLTKANKELVEQMVKREKDALKGVSYENLALEFEKLYNTPADPNFTLVTLKRRIIQQIERNIINDVLVQQEKDIQQLNSAKKIGNIVLKNKRRKTAEQQLQQEYKKGAASKILKIYKKKKEQQAAQNPTPNQPVDPNATVGIGFKKGNTW